MRLNARAGVDGAETLAARCFYEKTL